MSSITTAVTAACVGAAVCAGVYVIWGPDHFFRKKGRCLGIINLGNTCFINTILQSLATLPGLEGWLEEVAALHRGPLGQALRDMVRTLSEDRDGVCSPKEVLQALQANHWRIDFQQQDAHELYHILLTTLEEEMVSQPSLLEVCKMETPIDSRTWSRSGSVMSPHRPLHCPLRGMLTSELHCIQCRHSSPLKYESFNSISLTLPQYKCTLENCLLEFVKSEVVYEVECAHCSKGAGVPVKQTHLKKLHLVRAPACLCIHLNRSLWASSASLWKNALHMAFPVQLDATRLLRREGRSAGVRYLLCAVVEHQGGPQSGHYITYRRCGRNGRQWVYVSDTSVYSTDIQEVLGAEAYMLFYCRITA